MSNKAYLSSRNDELLIEKRRFSSGMPKFTSLGKKIGYGYSCNHVTFLLFNFQPHNYKTLCISMLQHYKGRSLTSAVTWLQL